MVDRVRVRLRKSNYCVDELTVTPRNIILSKKVRDAYNVSQSIADNLKSFSRFLNGVPLIIAETYRGNELEEDVIYTRYSIPVVNRDTAEFLLEGERNYFIYVNKGGIFIKINGKKLKELRERKGLSRARLARELGVSVKAIAYYEEGASDISLELAPKLEEVLGREIFEKLSINSLRELFLDKVSGEEDVRDRKIGRENKDIERIIQFLGDIIREKYFFDKAPFDAGFKITTNMFLRFAVKSEISGSEDLEEISRVSQATNTPTLIISDRGEIPGAGEMGIIPVDKQRLERIRELLVGTAFSSEKEAWLPKNKQIDVRDA
jgi:putative transcriptional regulator